MNINTFNYYILSIWPYILMFGTSLVLTLIFIKSKKLRSINKLIFFALPAWFFLIFSFFVLVQAVIDLSSIRESLYKESIKILHNNKHELIQNLKEGDYFEINKKLFNICQKAHISKAGLFTTPNNNIISQFGGTDLRNLNNTYIIDFEDPDKTAVIWGYIKYEIDANYIQTKIEESRQKWLLISLVLFIAISVFSTVISVLIYKHIKELINIFKSLSIVTSKSENIDELILNLKTMRTTQTTLTEDLLLRNDISIIANNLAHLQTKLKISESEAAIGKLSAQVSHDLKSPLSVIRIVCSDKFGLSNEAQSIAQQAILRIESILEDIKLTSKTIEIAEINSASDLRPTNLNNTIKELVNEFELKYPSRLFQVKKLFSENSRTLVDLKDFKRILSNILQNSVEATNNLKGVVDIECSDGDNYYSLTITDNGQGIDSSKLSLLAEKGFTFGKENGNGLGLWHAKNSLTKWGGSISFKSKKNIETTVTLKLVKCVSD